MVTREQLDIEHEIEVNKLVEDLKELFLTDPVKGTEAFLKLFELDQ